MILSNWSNQTLDLLDLKIIKSFSAIDQGGDTPAGNEDANDREAEIRRVVIQTADDEPEATFKPESVGDLMVDRRRALEKCDARPE